MHRLAIIFFDLITSKNGVQGGSIFEENWGLFPLVNNNVYSRFFAGIAVKNCITEWIALIHRGWQNWMMRRNPSALLESQCLVRLFQSRPLQYADAHRGSGSQEYSHSSPYNRIAKDGFFCCVALFWVAWELFWFID